MNNFFEADLKAPALREPVKKANDNVRYVLMAEFEFKLHQFGLFRPQEELKQDNYPSEQIGTLTQIQTVKCGKG